MRTAGLSGSHKAEGSPAGHPTAHLSSASPPLQRAQEGTHPTPSPSAPPQCRGWCSHPGASACSVAACRRWRSSCARPSSSCGGDSANEQLGKWAEMKFQALVVSGGRLVHGQLRSAGQGNSSAHAGARRGSEASPSPRPARRAADATAAAAAAPSRRKWLFCHRCSTALCHSLATAAAEVLPPACAASCTNLPTDSALAARADDARHLLQAFHVHSAIQGSSDNIIQHERNFSSGGVAGGRQPLRAPCRPAPGAGCASGRRADCCARGYWAAMCRPRGARQRAAPRLQPSFGSRMWASHSPPTVPGPQQRCCTNWACCSGPGGPPSARHHPTMPPPPARTWLTCWCPPQNPQERTRRGGGAGDQPPARRAPHVLHAAPLFSRAQTRAPHTPLPRSAHSFKQAFTLP